MTPQCNLPQGFTAQAALKIETDSPSVARGLEELFEMADGDRAQMGYPRRGPGRQSIQLDRNRPRDECRLPMDARRRPQAGMHGGLLNDE